LHLHADPGMLDQVAMNLAVNARDAMPEGGRLLIETSEKIVDEVLARQHPEAAPGHYVGLSVTDTGCGIPPEVLPKIFEPFFTTKEPGKGTGLGLATVFGIVKQHRGWLTVESAPGQGTTFNIFLPATTAAAPLAEGTKPKSRGGTETILLAEDDQAVRKATVTTLTRHGYRVVEAANGPEALALWSEHHDAIALLFTDLVMPGGLSGRQLAQTLQAGNPGLKVIYASGYSAEIAGRELRLQAGENFLQKPYLPQDLLRALRACLDV
jgi:CheY-like chemotaxis protein